MMQCLRTKKVPRRGYRPLTEPANDVFYKNASYNFSPMYYRFRGLDNAYQTVYINGVAMNDLVRGRFNFSSLLGMTSRAFRNKTTSVGLDAAAYGFGDLGGSVNYNTITDTYAPRLQRFGGLYQLQLHAPRHGYLCHRP